ncbi:hypothetical protein CAEBREN_10571 [Caenorhabditis brenneri]|uniref:Glycosyltransferase family 92 protein n=1 Tax=Caenorhabditis brenneri TaxID=135651 RepID=G0NE20_CAEBE|nr:hypothetical protein CAEBREN_10571 [Caenorhabditis brenneri]
MRKEDVSDRWSLLVAQGSGGSEKIGNSSNSWKSHALFYTFSVVLFVNIVYFSIFVTDKSQDDDLEDPIFAFNSSHCPYEEWNTIRTSEIPNSKLHAEWASKNISNPIYLYHTLPSVLAAFVYKDQITVTLTSENQYNASVFCRYYDCRRQEIIDPFPSVIYPVSTVFCARRPGAKYISISKTLNDTTEYSVPIIPRIDKPPHYLTVCMATLYGDEPKFLQIVDFIEYYKLQGATFFHIYLRNVTDYDRILLDDYVRTGDIEIIKMHDHFWRDDFMWHNAQINDCHHRNKYFSKWTAVVDIDERIEMRSREYRTITDYLDSIHNASIVNLHFRVQWVIKQDNTPARYENEEQLTREMLFHKYQNISQPGGLWDQPKCIIRPEKVFAMHIHIPLAVYSGERFTPVDPSVGVVRHYRNVEQRVFNTGLKVMMSHAPFKINPIDKWIDEELTKSIVKRVQWVYDISDLPCIKKQEMYWVYGNINSECWLRMNGL